MAASVEKGNGPPILCLLGDFQVKIASRPGTRKKALPNITCCHKIYLLYLGVHIQGPHRHRESVNVVFHLGIDFDLAAR